MARITEGLQPTGPAPANGSGLPADPKLGAPTDEIDPLEPKPERWMVFLVASTALMMASIDSSIVATALSTIDHDLHAHINWSSWSITAYGLGRVLTLPLMGKLGDQFGRRRTFLWSIALFTVSSLACGLSSDVYMLVVFRFIQALGGGAFVPSVMAMISEQFGRSRDRAIGLYSSIIPVGGIIGPILGGVFVQYWTWRGIFFVNVPISVIVIALAFRYIPKYAPGKAQPLDIRGAFIFSAMLLASMLGITFLGNGSVTFDDPRFLIAIVASIALGYVFVRHAKSHEAPIIPLRLLVGHGFGIVNTVNVLLGATALGFGALVPLYAQRRYHIDVLNSGTLLTGRAVGVVIFAALSTFMLRRIGYRIPMMIGLVISAVGMFLLSLSPSLRMSPYAWLAVASTVMGIGLGTMNPASNNAGLKLAPDDIGAVAGLRTMFRIVGSIIGVSVASAVIARATNQGVAQSHEFFVFSLVILVTLPLVLLIPDHRGRW